MGTIEIFGYVLSIILAFIISVITLKRQGQIKQHQSYSIFIGLTLTILGICLILLLSFRYSILPEIKLTQERSLQIATANKISDLNDILINSFADNDPLFQENISERINEFNTIVSNARLGRYIVREDELLLYSNKLLNSADESILATSYVRPENFWSGDQGRTYLETNCRRVENGITVTRYFIFIDNNEFEEWKHMIREQIECNIKVYVLIADGNYRHASDLIIIDNKVGGELELTPDRDIVEATMYTRISDINRIRQRFEQIQVRSINAQDLFN